MVMHPTQFDTIIMASRYGLIRISNKGQQADAIPLVTAPDDAEIFSLAINRTNGDHLYYGTNQTFYRSLDGGQTWATQDLPSSRAAEHLFVHLTNDDIIFMALRNRNQE